MTPTKKQANELAYAWESIGTPLDEIAMNLLYYQEEVKFLKNTVAALEKMRQAYVTGKPKVPEWVFDVLYEARKKYGDNLVKLKDCDK